MCRNDLSDDIRPSLRQQDGYVEDLRRSVDFDMRKFVQVSISGKLPKRDIELYVGGGRQGVLLARVLCVA